MANKEPSLADAITTGLIDATISDAVEGEALTSFLDQLPTQSPMLQGYNHWRDLIKNERLPRRSDIDPLTIGAAALPHVVLIDVENTGKLRFRYRLVGGFVIQIFGANYTGQYLDQMNLGSFFDPIANFFSTVCQKRTPLLLDGAYIRKRGAPFHIRRLALPLINENDEVDSLFCIFERLETGKHLHSSF